MTIETKISGNAELSERERKEAQRKELLHPAYIIDHSIGCIGTDWLSPVVASMSDGKYKLPGGCGHDHSKDGGHHDHVHNHHEHGPTCNHGTLAAKRPFVERFSTGLKEGFNKDRLKHWIQGEILSDTLSVPVTLAFQRYAPDFMEKIRHVIEPAIGPAFRWGITRSSKVWAKEHNIAIDSEAFKTHVNGIYEHEMSHAPQAVIWTLSAIMINVTYQMIVEAKPDPVFLKELGIKLKSCIKGQAITATTVMGSRILAPHLTYKVDEFTNTKLVEPVTNAVGKLFGVEPKNNGLLLGNPKKDDSAKWADAVSNTQTLVTQR